MSKRVYRLLQLVGNKEKHGLLPVSGATIWRWVRDGRFPKPFKLGAATTVWDAAEVEAFIAAQQGGR
jgi:predicted DNA-binding transcriptional regulator AlpA